MVDAFIGSQFPHWQRTDDLSRLVAAINRRQARLCRQQFDRGAVPLRQGMSDFIDTAARSGLRLALETDENGAEVSSLLRTNMGTATRRSIEVVIARDPTAGQPGGSPYSQALAALGVDSRSCLAVASSLPDVRSATDAGIPTAITCGLYSQLQDCCDLMAADGRAAYASSTIVSRWNAGGPERLLAELRMVHAAKTAANDAFDISIAATPLARKMEIAHARL
jgi:beta-phosphoglucomutase-like phosphatase (HAD superfamily)